MSYISNFVEWCRIWKKEARDTLMSFLYYLSGIVMFEASPLFIIVPLFLFFLTQYFHYLYMTEYFDKYFRLTKEELDTCEMLDKISNKIPEISRFAAHVFMIFAGIAYFF